MGVRVKNTKRLGAGLLSLLFLATIFTLVLPPARSMAAGQITDRSLTLQQGSGGNGGSMPGGVVNHSFTFTVPDYATATGSIQFKYCMEARGSTCTLPTGLVTTSATLGSETGITGYTLVNTTNGSPYLTKAAATIASPGTITVVLDGITNPTTTNQTFFVQISTFGSTDTTGTAIDQGTVAASTANQIVLTGTMPESLIFCTGATVSTTLGIPDCTTATAGNVTFNQLFSPTATATATSQMAASTNAGSGYAITINGPTMTSGANTIAGMSSAGASVVGTAQFGTNLVVDTTPAVGTAITPASNVGSQLLANPTANYGTANSFKFTTGDTIAQSNFGGSLGATNAQIYTSSYIINVPGSQPAGTYTTTLTYICTPTY